MTDKDSDQQDILAALTSDHASIDEQLGICERGVDAEAEDLSVECEQLVMQVVRHFVAEEEYLFPLVERILPDGEALAHASMEEHERIEDALRQLEDLDDEAAAAEPVLAEVRRRLAQHIDVQVPLFELLRSQTDEETLLELGDKVWQVEVIAPTRPRAVHLESAPANKVWSVVTGYLDKIRDEYSERGVDKN